MFWLVYLNVLKITHLAQNVKYFSYSLDDSFSQLSKEVRLLCWDSRKSKQRKWSDVFQKIQVDINFILICGTKLRTFKQKVRPQWILLWCIFMWKKLGTNLSTLWKIYSRFQTPFSSFFFKIFYKYYLCIILQDLDWWDIEFFFHILCVQNKYLMTFFSICR